MRVLIIGAGPAGLTTAHCLLKAGLPASDLTILERRADPLDHGGAGIALYPHTLRIMDQLGVLGEIENYGERLEESWHANGRGRVYARGGLFRVVEECNGYPTLVMARSQLVKALYDTLPNASTIIKPNKKLASIAQTHTSATATCGDSSSYTADIIIGGDGVHSAVRQLAIDSAPAPAPPPASSASSSSASSSASAELRVLFGQTPLLPSMPQHTMTEFHTHGSCLQILSSSTTAYWLFYTLKPSSERYRTHYTDEDAEQLAGRYASQPASEGGKMTFKQLWKDKIWAGLYDLEEGCEERWHKGRIVLVGDAAHRMCPNAALGGNSAIESAAALANALYPLLSQSSSSSITAGKDTSAIEAAFAAYQNARLQRAKDAIGLSAGYARQAVWQTRSAYFVSRWLSPLVSQTRVAQKYMAPWFGDGVGLEFVREPERWKGKGSRMAEVKGQKGQEKAFDEEKADTAAV